MTDNLSKAKRSANMKAVRSRDTGPEIRVRQIIHRLGYRFRLHRRDLPGKPDIVFPAHLKVIFVNGCFWHQHGGCGRAAVPESNLDFWLPKLKRNKVRDQKVRTQLRRQNWRSLVIWECELSKPAKLENKIAKFLALP